MSDSSSSSDASSSTVLKSICMTGRYGMPWKDLSPQIEKKIRHVRFRFVVSFLFSLLVLLRLQQLYILLCTQCRLRISQSLSPSLSLYKTRNH
jgi:hypothetical protein